MIWHVIKKDFKSLWWLGPVLAAAAGAYGFATYYRYEQLGRPSQLLTGIVQSLPYILACLSLMRVVQADSTVTRLADWHTRPIKRSTLLAAKALIALFGIVLPWGLVDFAWGMSWGLSAAECLKAAGIHMGVIAAGCLAVMSLAAAFRTLMQSLLAAGILFGAAFLFGESYFQFVRFIDRSWPDSPARFTAPIYIGCAVVSVVCLIACLALLYSRRKTGPARAALVAAVIGTQAIALTAAQAEGRTWRDAPPAPASLQNVSASFDPNGVVTPPSMETLPRGQIGVKSVPVRINRRPDQRVLNERFQITQTDADGSQTHWRGFHADRRLIIASGYFPEGAPSKLDVRYRLIIGQFVPHPGFPADGRIHRVAGLGQCRARPSPLNLGRMDIRCLGVDIDDCITIGDSSEGMTGRCQRSWNPLLPYREATARAQRVQSTVRVTARREVGVVDGGFTVPQDRLSEFRFR